MWRSQPPAWGPRWSLHTEVDPSCPSLAQPFGQVPHPVLSLFPYGNGSVSFASPSLS